MNQVSVLHVLAPSAFGGLEAVVQMLALGARGTAVVPRVAAVVSRGGAEHPFLAPLRGAGVEVFPVAVGPRAYLSERRAVAALCRRLEPDVVHSHGYRADVLDAPVAQRLQVPVVTTVHGFTGGDWKNRLYERLQRRALRRFDAVVAVSRALGELLVREGVGRERVAVLPNAWERSRQPLARDEARRLLGIPQDAVLVGWVGRMTREKGADVFLDAMARLADVPCLASCVGEGSDRAGLEARGAALGLAGRLRWHGLVPDAGRIFPAFDVFVLSSRTEGTPITLFEAMAAEVPVVATAVGGVPDVVSGGEALLTAPDNPVQLAAAIRSVLSDRAAAHVRAARARARLERDFAVGPWMARYEAVYRGVLTTRRA
jgi:glycosyltransferase involved in cell wall biosynthesis